MADQTFPGPIDFILIEFPQDASTSAVADALTAILERDIVHLYDIAAVRKDADGDVTRVDLDHAASTLEGFAAFAGAQSGLFDAQDISDAGAILDAGMSGLLLAYENSWASGFVGAAHSAGGRVIASERIPAQVLVDALESLEAS